MGIKEKIYFTLMNQALKIIFLLAIVSQINCATRQNESSSSKRELFKLPEAICKPAKNIGDLIAAGVVKCAKDALNKKTRRAQAVQKPASSADLKDMGQKLVAALLSKVGCARRLTIAEDIKNHFKKVGDNIKKAFTPKKTRRVNVFDDIAAGAKKVGKDIKKAFTPKKTRRMNIFEDIGNAAKKLGDKVKKGFTDLGKSLAPKKERRRMNVLEDIKQKFKDLGNKVKNAFTPKKDRRERRMTVLEDIKKLGEKVKDHFKSLAPKKDLRRMSFLDTIAKGFKDLGNKVKEGFKSIGKSALKLACKTFETHCPKACDSAINAVAPFMKNLHIPTKCSDETAKGVCHTACKALCKGM